MARPLEGSYWATVAIVVLALAPDIVLTTAYGSFQPLQLRDLGTSPFDLELSNAISNAGYAFGAVLAADLINRFTQRRLFFLCQSLFVVGSVVAAAAPGIVAYASGRVLQGLVTGMLLVIAVPPLVQSFGLARLRLTTVVLDIGFFGAVTAGPLVGGLVGQVGGWRPLFLALGGCGVVGVGLALVTLPLQEPQNPGMSFDGWAIALALAATVLPFYAAAELTRRPFHSPLFVSTLAAGILCLVVLLVAQYRKQEPLAPVKPLSTTVPLIGTLAATIGGGVFVTLLVLEQQYLSKIEKRSPLAAGLAFWPQLLGLGLSAVLLYLLVVRRHLPYLVLGGMLALVAGGLLFVAYDRGDSNVLVLAGAALLGVGAGATVSPGLWLAGFSLPAKIIGRTFALVELIRSEGDFVMAPVLRAVAQVRGKSEHSPAAGIHYGLWATIVVAGAGTLLGCAIWFGGRARPQEPDLETWLEGEEPAIGSPALADAVRG